MREYARDAVTGRRLFVLEIASPEALPELHFDTPHFACVLAWDSAGASVDAIERLATRLLRAGAAYVCCWGDGCERVHDIIDEVDLASDVGSPEGHTVMTTWHARERLRDALWFGLNCAWPDSYAESTLGSTLAVSIGNSSYAIEMRRAFADPRAFSRLVADQD